MITLAICGIVYVSIGAMLAAAAAVTALTELRPVRITGMIRIVLLWPLAVMALMLNQGRSAL